MDAITLENGQTVLPDWAKEVTLKKMASTCPNCQAQLSLKTKS